MFLSVKSFKALDAFSTLPGFPAELLEPENHIASVGSGGNFALAAARAMYEGKKSSEEIAIKAINIASEICVYTNDKVRHLTLNST